MRSNAWRGGDGRHAKLATAGVGLYRLAVKWGLFSRVGRAALWRIEHILFWFFIGFGTLVLVVLAGWLPPPLGFLTAG